MEKIELKEVLPAAFAAGGPAVLRSEIWRREVTFRRGEFCLVEAASGAGKSSLCSFLYGIRGDYAGRILSTGWIAARFPARRGATCGARR